MRGNNGVTPETAARYLAERLGARVDIQSLKQSFPGFSRETYLVRTVIGEEPRGFVIRVDPPAGGGVPLSLHREYEIYQRLWHSPVPVAEPLWFDEGLEFAEGRPHMVRDLVQGGTSIAGLTDETREGAALRRRIARNHIEHLALLHQLDWERFGFAEIMPAPRCTKDALRHELEIWRQFWLEGRTEPFPLMTEALYWLEEQVPDDTPFVSLTKGNNGVGEEIFRCQRIVAMSDWELACLSDGVLDLPFSQGTLAMDDFDASLQYYGECVGHEVSPQRLAFATFMVMLKAMVCLNTCFFRRHLEGHDPRIVSAAMALNVRQSERRFAVSIGKDIVTAMHDLGNPAATSQYARIGAKE